MTRDSESAGNFDELFAANYTPLTRLVYRVVGDIGWAEELAAEAFWKLHRNPPASDHNLSGWLYRTGLRLALDNLKKRKRRARYEALAPGPEAMQSPEDALEQREQRTRVRQVLAALKPQQAALLVLRSEGYSLVEIASILALNTGSVGTLLARADIAFRKESGIDMENVNQQELRQWVMHQTGYLNPPAGWLPNSSAALTLFHARMETDRAPATWRRWLVWGAAPALLGLVLLLLPAGRVVAQQLWQFLTVRQVAFVRVNPWPEGVASPQVKLIGTPIPPIPAADVNVAGARVPYEPRLPRPGVLSGTPRLSTTFSLSAGTVVKAADLQLALRKAGATDETVPPTWDGAQLTLHTSAIVIAEWPDIVFAQSLPLTLTAPPGFDFPAFSALVLRVLGVGANDAQRLAQRMVLRRNGWHPSHGTSRSM